MFLQEETSSSSSSSLDGTRDSDLGRVDSVFDISTLVAFVYYVSLAYPFLASLVQFMYIVKLVYLVLEHFFLVPSLSFYGDYLSAKAIDLGKALGRSLMQGNATEQY